MSKGRGRRRGPRRPRGSQSGLAEGGFGSIRELQGNAAAKAPPLTPGTIPAKAVTGGHRSDGGEGLPYGVQAGDFIAEEQPAGYMDTGITMPDGQKVWRAVPPGLASERTRGGGPVALRAPGREVQPGEVPEPLLREARLRRGTMVMAGHAEVKTAIRENWSAAEVLAGHANLADRYRRPSGELLDYLAWFMGGVHEQAGSRSAGMFYPVDPGKSPTLAHARELSGLIAHGLVTAEPYQVTAKMAAALEVVLHKRALELDTLHEAELPCASGFAWLDAPWVVRDIAGSELPVRVMTWERCSVRSDGIAGWDEAGEVVKREEPRILPAARLSLWCLVDDDATLHPEDYEDPGSLAFDQVVLGPLRLVHTQPVPFGIAFAPAESEGGAPAASILAMIRVLWIYLGMTLTRSGQVQRETVLPPRADRRRMPQSLQHNQVHVVTLRQYVTISDELPGHREVHRTCRWWTGDFFRHIDPYEDYDEEGRRRRHQPVPVPRPGEDHDICEVCLARGDTIRVTPVRGHMRGPSWLPLKQPAHDKTLRRLAR